MSNLNQSLNNLLQGLTQPNTASFLKLFLVLYAGMAAPKLPDNILSLFDNAAFRLFVLFLVLWTGNSDPTLSLLIAVSFTITMNSLAGRGIFETFRIEQNTNVIPMCLNITMNDILAKFNGDEDAMKRAIYNVVTPLNIPLNFLRVLNPVLHLLPLN